MPSHSPDRRPSRRRLAGLIVWFSIMLAAGGAGSWAQTQEFRVNSYTTGIQQRPQIATFPHGGFVVAWQSSQSPGDDANGRSILGRRFDSSASPLGEDFQINTETAFSQTLAQIAPLANDGFVVVWNTASSPLLQLGESGDIKGQIFDSSGNPTGSEFQINAPGEVVSNYGHEVSANDQGGFAVVWVNHDDDLFLRPYDSSGSALTAALFLASDECFLVSGIGTVAGSIYLPVWSCVGSNNEIFFRRYDSTGTPLAPTQSAPAQGRSVAMVPTDDGFLFAYQVTGAENWSGQRFDSAGTATGDAFEMSRDIHSIAAAGAEGFATVWYDGVPAGSDDDRLSIKRGRFSASGGVLSAESQVNVFTTHDQVQADVGALADGRFVVVWASYFSDDGDNNWSIRAGILNDDLFSDGFESANAGAWSQAVP